ncbi:MAG: urease accessory protein UreD [Synechocystis sp.]|nr:urease accessory protein UreD [Synechocystis sp.]
MSAPDAPPPLPWQATLTLGYDCVHAKTRLTHCLVEAPLKVQRPFYDLGSAQCQTMLLHTGGGMVGGDRLIYDIDLADHSDVMITTASAGKVYRSQGPWSQQRVNLRLGAKAAVEWMPQETILFEAALYDQTFHIDLDPTARFKGWEIMRLGRTARGETFAQGHWRSRWEVWQAGQLIWAERQQAIGSPTLKNTPNALGGYPILGTYLDLSRPFTPELLTLVREITNPLIQRRSEQIGFSLTATQGLIGRYRGTSSQQAKAIFSAIRHLDP